MANTDNLNMPEIAASQAQKHVTHNEALLILDAIVQLSVIDRGLSTPPGSPVAGDRYIVATSGTGDWSGHDGKIAAYQNGAWEIYAPVEGWRCYLEDEDILVIHDGTNWVNPNLILELLGVGGATPDTTNKLSVNSDAILFNHDGSDSQVKVNKNAVGDDAGFVFQTGFSTRALFGTLANDDFTIKVSPDGSSFTTAMVIDKDNGYIGVLKSPSSPLDVNGDIHSDGISFSSGTHILDYYEIGTFTPVLSDGVNADATYTTQLGEYVRIGNAVTCNIRIVTSAIGTISGDLVVTGLPFTSSSVTTPIYAGRLKNMNLSTGEHMAGFVKSSNTEMVLVKTGATVTGSANFQDTEWSADGDAMLSMSYKVA